MFVYASFRVVYVAVHVVAIVISYDSAWSLNRARLSVAIFSHRRVCVLEVCDWCENGTIFFGAHVMLTNAYQRLRLSATMSYCNCGASICLPLKCDAMEERCAVASWCARLATAPNHSRTIGLSGSSDAPVFHHVFTSCILRNGRVASVGEWACGGVHGHGGAGVWRGRRTGAYLICSAMPYLRFVPDKSYFRSGSCRCKLVQSTLRARGSSILIDGL